MRVFLLLPLTVSGLTWTQETPTDTEEPWPPGHNIPEQQAAAALEEMGATWNDKVTWQRRRQRIRQHVLDELQLSPPPERTDLRPVIHSRIEHDDYAVSNVYFESFPGFYVTGNLYEPLGRQGLIPVIVAPHGHKRRSADNPEGRMQHDYQKLCGTLARMGALVFTWDMVGWGENGQMEHQVPDAGAIQTWNTIRAIDFATSLPRADRTKVAATGSSGGGTQTFLAALVDDRICASAPIVMVSAHWFGGCPCESGLPLHRGADFRTNNVELAACAAPRPQLLVSVGGDWTRNTPGVEFPYLQRVYAAYGYPERIHNAHFPDEQHDYGPSKRTAVYAFLARELDLDVSAVTTRAGAIDESAVVLRPRNELLALTGEHALPATALQTTQAVLQAWKALERKVCDTGARIILPLRPGRGVYGSTMGTLLGVDLMSGEEVWRLGE